MMTTEQMKDALRSGHPVEWVGPMDYDRARGSITAIIITYSNGAFRIAAEITDRRGNVTRCLPSQLNLYEPPRQKEEKNA